MGSSSGTELHRYARYLLLNDVRAESHLPLNVRMPRTLFNGFSSKIMNTRCISLTFTYDFAERRAGDSVLGTPPAADDGRRRGRVRLMVRQKMKAMQNMTFDNQALYEVDPDEPCTIVSF